MEVAMELEDDVFFADLSKQISLLIMDDDEDSVARCPSVSLQAFSRQACHHSTAPSPVFYEQTCKRESKGTGVFIPRSSLPRRKNRQGKSASSYKSYRQSDRSQSVSNVTYSTNNDQSCSLYSSKNC